MTSVFAHRGASAAAPENTVKAFLLAADMGADGIELDARRTADGAVVVHHDAHLPDGRPIVGVARADLPDRVPTLAAALDACGQLVVNIEIKNIAPDPDFDPEEAVAGHVVTEVRRRRWHERVLVSSFSLDTIDRIRQLDPTIPTAFLVAWETDPVALIDRTVRHGHSTLHPWDAMTDAPLVEAAHAAGLVVNVWTVDEPDRMTELMGFGVDGIVTNVPDIARRVVDGSANC